MKTKKTLLTIALFTLVLFLNAQQKYNYLLIQFVPILKNEIQISIDGKEYKEEKADYSPTEKANFNVNPILKKVTEYEEKEWELLSFQSLSIGSGGMIVYHAYMRKKKVDKN